MRFSVLVLCVGVAAAVQYSDLKDVLAHSSVHTLRLSEISATVESEGPMDQVGTLCYQQMREIAVEIDELDTTHLRFTRNCLSTLNSYNTRIGAHQLAISNADKKSAEWSLKWNALRLNIPPIRRKREEELKKMNELEAFLVKKQGERDETKKVYDQDMVDFAAALKDIADLRKIIGGSALGDQKTSGAVAKEGFLQAVDQVQSDKLRQMTNRFALAAEFFEQDAGDGATSIDKIEALLLKIRNEMWAEMDKLTKLEAASIAQWRQLKLNTRTQINALALSRARRYIEIGQILSQIGKFMTEEAEERIISARRTKEVDADTISKHFLEESCAAEPPMYQKSRAVKMAEVATIEKMLKILRGLKWTGAVYNAISRIRVAGVDENPEPGYFLGFQMNVHLGLTANNYEVNNRDTKDFGRVAIKLQIGTSWVWASFDSWTDDAARYLIPTKNNAYVNQRIVTNLRVHKSASARVKSQQSKAASGNVEMWINEAKPRNAKNVPGASDGLMDFGDELVQSRQFYGSFQVHDYLQKQTVLAVNNFFQKGKHDVGIGSQEGRGTQPDWTGAHNSHKYQSRQEAVTISWYFQNKGFAAQKGK